MDSHYSILIVDDEPNLRTTLSLILQRDGYTVTTAGNADEAHEQLHARQFDLVFLDIKMPKKSGLILLTEIKQQFPDLPVLLLTAFASLESAIEAVRRGVDMFDCVMPTRNGRHGLAFTWAGRVNLRNAKHAEDLSALDTRSTCPAARDYSRAYLHHLVRAGEYLGSMLLSWSNTAFYQQLMSAMRLAIAESRFDAWAEETLAGFERDGG